MPKARSGAPRLLLVVPLGLLVSSCAANAASAPEPDPAPDQAVSTSWTTDLQRGSSSSIGDDTESPALVGIPAGAISTDEEAIPVEGIVAGTDSSTPNDLTPPEGALRTQLVDFATIYLGFDYRVDHRERVERLRPLVTPGLLEQLAAPLPSSLRQRFDQEQRITEASVVELRAVDAGVYALTMSLTTSIANTAQADTAADARSSTTTGDDDDVRVLVVVVDDEEKVSDVR